MNSPEEYVKEHIKGYEGTIPGDEFYDICTTIAHEYDMPLEKATAVFYANCGDLKVGEVLNRGVGKRKQWPGQNQAVNFSKSNPGALAEPMSSLRISASDVAHKVGDEVRVKKNDQAPWGAEYTGIIERVNNDNTFDIRDVYTEALNTSQPARLLAVPMATGREDLRIQQRRVGDPKGMGESAGDVGGHEVKQDYPNANWVPAGHPGQEVKNPQSMFYKEAMAIGPNDRIWMSNQELNLPLDINYSQDISDKPEGLWYALGTSWADFVASHIPERAGDDIFYKITVDPSKILHIKTPEEIDAFTKEYGDTTKGGDPEKPFYINWPKVAEKYSGIEISPYIGSRRREHMWYYGWDVPSGCVWNNDAVTDTKKITHERQKKEGARHEVPEGGRPIDADIDSVIDKLTDLGFSTEYSCSGTKKDHMDTDRPKLGYIAFASLDKEQQEIISNAARAAGLSTDRSARHGNMIVDQPFMTKPVQEDSSINSRWQTFIDNVISNSSLEKRPRGLAKEAAGNFKVGDTVTAVGDKDGKVWMTCHCGLYQQMTAYRQKGQFFYPGIAGESGTILKVYPSNHEGSGFNFDCYDVLLNEVRPYHLNALNLIPADVTRVPLSDEPSKERLDDLKNQIAKAERAGDKEKAKQLLEQYLSLTSSKSDPLLTFLLTSIAKSHGDTSSEEVKSYLDGKISSPSRSLKEILHKYNIVAAAGDPMLNVEKALGEVKDKTEVQINTETAWTWGSRAAACYKLSNEALNAAEKEKWVRLGDAYRHESLEHASLAEDDGKLVGEVYKALAPFRKPAGTPEK